MQLTKKPIMDGIDFTKNSLDVIILVLGCLKVNITKCNKGLTEELYASEEVYKLMKEGVAFIAAYEKISKKLK